MYTFYLQNIPRKLISNISQLISFITNLSLHSLLNKFLVFLHNLHYGNFLSSHFNILQCHIVISVLLAHVQFSCNLQLSCVSQNIICKYPNAYNNAGRPVIRSAVLKLERSKARVRPFYLKTKEENFINVKPC